MARPPPAPQQPGLFGVITARRPSLLNPQPWRFGNDRLIAQLAPPQPDPAGYVAGPDGALLRRRLGLDPYSRRGPARPMPWGLSWGAEPVPPDDVQAWLERRLDADSYRPGRMSPQEERARAALISGRGPLKPPRELPLPKVAQATSDTPGVRELRDEIARSEKTESEVARQRGFVSSYDVPFGYGKFGRPPKPLSQMTLDEVEQYQRRLLANGSPSSVVGRYQFHPDTLRGLRKKLQLKGDEVFGPDLQDRLVLELFKERGLEDLRSGGITAEAFTDRLAPVWASIPHTKTGRSHYEQPIGTTISRMRAILAGLEPRPQTNRPKERERR